MSDERPGGIVTRMVAAGCRTRRQSMGRPISDRTLRCPGTVEVLKDGGQ